MRETDNLNQDNLDIYGELSLESILAEYADFDAEAAAAGETASRARQIVYESLGETGFSGGVESVEADSTAEPAPDLSPEQEPDRHVQDYCRRASGYTGRLRRGLGRARSRRGRDAGDSGAYGEDAAPCGGDAGAYAGDAGAYGYDSGAYAPDWDGSASQAEEASRAGAWAEPAFEQDPGDDDVKVYRPRGAMPEGDEDVKIYGEGGPGADELIAEAERRSSRWAAPAAVEDAAYSAYTGGDAGDAYVPDNDSDAFGGWEDGGVREYGAGSDDGYEYASPGSEDAPRPDYGAAPKAGPLLGFLASLGVKLRNARTAGSAVAVEDAEDLGEEMSAKKAGKYYGSHVRSLRLRLRLAIAPTAVLLWVSLGLPAFGALGSDLKATSLVCLVLQLSVVMLGLDVFTGGIMSMARGRPGLWSLCALANVAAALDAAVAYSVGTAGWGFPMCAAAAASMLFALWGALLEARALRFSVRAKELSEDPASVTAETGVDGREGAVLLKSKGGTDGWLRRCEEPDEAESLFSTAAPWLTLAAVLLAAAATVITQRWTYFFRVLAAAACAAAPVSAFVACPLPYFTLAIRTFRHGAAVAGWPGMRDIGRAVGMVVTDSDLFPEGSVKISSIRILDGAAPEHVIADAGSVIVASGGGLAGVFTELMARNGCALRRVEDFCCHEGGGLTALIAGEEVLCGSAAFMRLMGVMVPQKLADRSAVFISINGVLSGIFNIEYTPAPSVGRALAACLRMRRVPVFAVRDFLVTPLMLHRKYRVPAEGFDFPLFAVRYAVSGTQPSGDSRPCALLGREGLGAFMEVASTGRRCYLAGMLGSALALAGAVAGVGAVFALFAFGGGVSVGWLLASMLLWLVPGAVGALL